MREVFWGREGRGEGRGDRGERWAGQVVREVLSEGTGGDGQEGDEKGRVMEGVRVADMKS